MTRIICDTMIWYELSKNNLQIPDPEKYTLVCTYLSLMELAFTPNNFSKLGEVQDAVKKILSIEPELIMHYPIVHARTLIDKDFKPEYIIEEDLVMAFLRVLLNHPKDGLINNKFKSQLAEVSSIRKENSTDWANFLNELKPSKEVVVAFKKHHENESDKEYVRNYFLLQLNQLSDKVYSKNSINWGYFELYENVGARYKRSMLLSKMKADRNDENDLKNMIYVQPSDKYWTIETRWNSIIKEINFDRYLYIH